MLQNLQNKTYILFILSAICFGTDCVRAMVNDTTHLYDPKEPHFYTADTILESFCQLKFINIINEIELYYSCLSEEMSDEQRKQEINKMEEISIRNNCTELGKEVQFLSALYLSGSISEKISRLETLFMELREDDEIYLKLRIMEAIFTLYWESSRFADAFHQAVLLEKELGNISEKDYPRKKYIYWLIGKAYFAFEDYEKASVFLRYSSRPSKYYFDTSGIEAKNMIGEYYLKINQPDSAEFYFRSALYSTEHVKNKLIYDALSMANIGKSYGTKGEYEEAIAYMIPALRRMQIDNMDEWAAVVMLDLAKCYFDINDFNKTKLYLDSTQLYLSGSGNKDLYPSLYYQICKYYSVTGNARLSGLYLDSVLLSTKEYGRKYNSLHIAMGQQEFFENESKTKDEYIKQNKRNYTQNLLVSLGVIVFITLIIIILTYLLRKNKKAYHALKVKNQEWAQVKSYYQEDKSEVEDEKVMEDTENETDINQPDEEDCIIVQNAHEYLIKNKEFKNIDLTLDLLAKELNINRNYLSKAINKTTGKNFNTYINEYRVKEAIKMLSDEKMSVLSIDAIALEVGFGNRISFYQAFKKITGLSPSNFRKQ